MSPSRLLPKDSVRSLPVAWSPVSALGLSPPSSSCTCLRFARGSSEALWWPVTNSVSLLVCCWLPASTMESRIAPGPPPTEFPSASSSSGVWFSAAVFSSCLTPHDISSSAAASSKLAKRSAAFVNSQQTPNSSRPSLPRSSPTRNMSAQSSRRGVGSMAGRTALPARSSKSNSNLRKTILGTSLQMMQQWTGINFVFYYSTPFLQSTGAISNTFLISLIFTLVNVCSTPISFYTVERFGRRPLLIWGAAGMVVCQFLVAIWGTASKTGTRSVVEWIIPVSCESSTCNVGARTAPEEKNP